MFSLTRRGVVFGASIASVAFSTSLRAQVVPEGDPVRSILENDPRVQEFNTWALQQGLPTFSRADKIHTAVQALTNSYLESLNRQEIPNDKPRESFSFLPANDYVSRLEEGAMLTLDTELALPVDIKLSFEATRKSVLSEEAVARVKDYYSPNGENSYFPGTEQFIKMESLRNQPLFAPAKLKTDQELMAFARAMEKEQIVKVEIAKSLASDLLLDIENAKASAEALRLNGPSPELSKSLQRSLEDAACRYRAIIAIRRMPWAPTPSELFNYKYIESSSK